MPSNNAKLQSMPLWHFLYRLPLIGILFFASLSIAGESITAQRIEWIDVHVHLVGGRMRDCEGAAQVALKAIDEAGVRASFVMPPPRDMRGSMIMRTLSLP